jgi:mannitol/fructose-specific phosphotransferase system IIA component (Ntr-type)
MIPISEILTPSHVNLALAATDQAAAVAEVLSKLNGDPRVLDWDALQQSITERNAPAISCGSCGICIAHGRTNAVQSLVMAAGRSSTGLASEHVQKPVRLVFVAGIPAAFHSEYLRVVGAIARLCNDKALLEKLLSAQDPEKFVALLTAAETKLT